MPLDRADKAIIKSLQENARLDSWNWRNVLGFRPQRVCGGSICWKNQALFQDISLN